MTGVIIMEFIATAVSLLSVVIACLTMRYVRRQRERLAAREQVGKL